MTALLRPRNHRRGRRTPIGQLVAIGVAVALVAVLPWQRLQGVAPAAAQTADTEYGWTAEDRDAWLNLANPRIVDRAAPSRDGATPQPRQRILATNVGAPPERRMASTERAAAPPGGRHIVWLQRLKLEGG